MKINSKAESRDLLVRGCLGNFMRTWLTLEDLLKDNFQGKVGIRYNEPRLLRSGFWRPNVPIAQAKEITEELLQLGAEQSRIYYMEMCDHNQSIISGEVMRSVRYLELTYSEAKLPLREALIESPRYCHGATAIRVIRECCGEDVLDWFNVLFMEYPDHVIEFSTFSTSHGILRHPTVIWEVRNY